MNYKELGNRISMIDGLVAYDMKSNKTIVLFFVSSGYVVKFDDKVQRWIENSSATTLRLNKLNDVIPSMSLTFYDQKTLKRFINDVTREHVEGG